MIYYRYECTTDNTFYNGRPHKLGDIIERASAVAPSGFTATNREIHTPSNNSYVDLDGTYYYGKHVGGWEDLRFPFTRDKQGQSAKPDFDFTNLGLLFPQDDDAEIVYLIIQFPHAMKRGSLIYPHVHFIQDEAEEPVFKLDYRLYGAGDDPTGGFTTIEAEDFAVTYVEGSISQLVGFPPIDMSGVTGLSPIMDAKIYRDDNVVSGDVLAKEFDIHYLADSLGSGRELQK